MNKWRFLVRAAIGIMIGIVFFIVSVFLLAKHCNWNPVCNANVRHSVVCDVVGYVFLVSIYLLSEPIKMFFPSMKNAVGVSVVSYLLFWASAGMFCGWFFEKLRRR